MAQEGSSGISNAANSLIALGIAVFVLTLIVALVYSGYAQTKNQLSTQYGSTSGVVANFTTNGGGIANTFGGNLGLAVFALVFVAIIVAIILAIRGAKTGEGGLLG